MRRTGRAGDIIVVTNIAEQLGSLGWATCRWPIRCQEPKSPCAATPCPDNGAIATTTTIITVTSLGYVDLSSIYGLLQQPGHQADIWYIGVYTPDQALGNFVLNGSLLTGQPMPFDGAGSTVSVANQPPGQWGFFQISVPADTNLLGWDVRLVGVTNGNPQMVVCRDTLPTGLSTGPWWWWSGVEPRHGPVAISGRRGRTGQAAGAGRCWRWGWAIRCSRGHITSGCRIQTM